jgi:hypothetical protein
VIRAVAVVAALAAASCLTTYNQYRYSADLDAPAVETRPAGCNVDIVEDGQKVTRKVKKLGHIVLDWPNGKIKEQGPDGALKTLRAAACENGAFMITQMRALPTADGGLVYEADLVTLLGDDGTPVNPKIVKAQPPAPPPSSGW